MKNIFLYLLYFLLPFSAFTADEQNVQKNSAAQITVQSDSNRVFMPSFATPQSGLPFPVNGDYRIRFQSKNFDVHLPYSGQAYSGADVLSGENPLSFISADFKTEYHKMSKGREEIIIRLNKPKDAELLRFMIYPDGNADLRISFLFRSSISFSGKILKE